MTLIVEKFGGTSVGTIDRIQHAADIVSRSREAGNNVVVVVSAMSGETDRLIQLANRIAKKPNGREYDALVSVGENISAALLTLALQERGYSAVSLTGRQAQIITSDHHQSARITKINDGYIRQLISLGQIPVITGFQGINQRGDVTTLGRGGSDTTAVAIAAALAADECRIYTDVEGVFTSDPRIVNDARLLEHLTYEEMLALASLGSKVLHPQSVEFAKKYRIPVRVLSSFSEGMGTLISISKTFEKPWVSGVAFDRQQIKFSILGIPKKPNVMQSIQDAINQQYFAIDMMIENLSMYSDTVDFSFTVHHHDYDAAFDFSHALIKIISAREIVMNDKIAKLSLVGLGMKSHPGVASKIFETLGSQGIHIYLIASTEAKVSAIVDEKHMETGARLLHSAFNLGSYPCVVE